jgi:hypothetical protein
MTTQLLTDCRLIPSNLANFEADPASFIAVCLSMPYCKQNLTKIKKNSKIRVYPIFLCKKRLTITVISTTLIRSKLIKLGA